MSDSSKPTGAPEIEITPAMIEAGKEAFFRMMIDRDYLASSPPDKDVSDIVASIFVSMSDKRP